MAIGSGIVKNPTLWTGSSGRGPEKYSIVPLTAWYDSLGVRHISDETSEAARKVRERLNQIIWNSFRIPASVWRDSARSRHNQLVGNRQEGMTPVEYRVVEGPRPWGFGGTFIRGYVLIDDQKVGNWQVSVDKGHFDAVKENLMGNRKEQPMARTLFVVYIVDGEELVYTWTGVASSAEVARLKVLQEFNTETDVEDLDIFTHALGCLRKRE